MGDGVPLCLLPPGVRTQHYADWHRRSACESSSATFQCKSFVKNRSVCVASAPPWHAKHATTLYIPSCPLPILITTAAHAGFLPSRTSRYHKNFLLAQNCCNKDPVYVPSSVSCFEYFPDIYDPGPPYCKPIIYIECQDMRSTSCNVVGPQDLA